MDAKQKQNKGGTLVIRGVCVWGGGGGETKENPAIQTQELMAFALSLALDPTFGTHSYKTLDTAQPFHLLKPS